MTSPHPTLSLACFLRIVAQPSSVYMTKEGVTKAARKVCRKEREKQSKRVTKTYKFLGYKSVVNALQGVVWKVQPPGGTMFS